MLAASNKITASKMQLLRREITPKRSSTKIASENNQNGNQERKTPQEENVATPKKA